LTAEAFFDNNNQPMLGPNGYARSAFTYDKDNNLTGSTYLDKNGNSRTGFVVCTKDIRLLLLGLEEGDVLLSYDGKELSCALQFLHPRSKEVYGEPKIQLQIVREGKKGTLGITTGPIPFTVGRTPVSGAQATPTFRVSFVETRASR